MGDSDVFQKVIYPAQPGICRTCGCPFGQRDMVDTGLTGDFCNRPHFNPVTEEVDATVDINLAGTVYICESCVVNMGMVFGMLPEFKRRELIAKVEHQQSIIIEKARKIVALESIVDGYRSLSTPDPSSVVDVSQPVFARPFAPEKSRVTEQGPTLDSPVSDGTNSGESQVSESDSEQRSDDVSRSVSGEPGESGDESINGTPGSGESETGDSSVLRI